MKDNNRKLSNLFVKSQTAVKFGKLILATWIGSLAVTIGGNYYIYSSLTNTLNEELGPIVPVSLTGSLNQFLIQSLAVNVLTLTGLVWVVFAFVTLINHRIFGPVESMKDFISHLKSGNYDPPKRNLREKDELVPLMDELNLLADKLKEQQNKTSSSS